MALVLQYRAQCATCSGHLAAGDEADFYTDSDGKQRFVHSGPCPGTTGLTCLQCGKQYDPSAAQIKGWPVCPSACNACLAAGFDAGRWQELFLYEVAKETE